MKENTVRYMGYGLLILAFLSLIFAFAGFFSGSASSRVVADAKISDSANIDNNGGVGNVDAGFQRISSGTTGSGDVSIELKPRGFHDGKLEVEFSANTHSVSMDSFDLYEIVTLDIGGVKTKPVSAPKLAGHHNSGLLVFDVGQLQPDNFTIKITGIPKVEDRIFEWYK